MLGRPVPRPHSPLMRRKGDWERVSRLLSTVYMCHTVLPSVLRDQVFHIALRLWSRVTENLTTWRISNVWYSFLQGGKGGSWSCFAHWFFAHSRATYNLLLVWRITRVFLPESLVTHNRATSFYVSSSPYNASRVTHKPFTTLFF